VGDFKLLEKLPKWGMTVDGVLFPLLALERYIREKDGSYWPTPTTSDRYNPCFKNDHDLRKGNLRGVVHYATPTASQANKPIREPSPSRKNKSHGEDLQDSIGRLNPESIGKRLSVEFVECLMGYPFKWSALNHLETQSCHVKLEKLFKSCRELNKTLKN
jgi:hypothetical protein